MARLALFAVLLLALVPTLGRLAQARETGIAATPSWAALCTARGLQAVLLPDAVRHALPGAGHGDGGSPASPQAPGGDCDYCPLLAAAIPLAAAPAAVPQAAPAPALCTFRTLPALAAPHPCGLGSRGPPSVS